MKHQPNEVSFLLMENVKALNDISVSLVDYFGSEGRGQFSNHFFLVNQHIYFLG